jgi:dCMP deaminase
MNREELKDSVMMTTAFAFAQLSTCCRFNVGTVIVIDGRIVSVGYNGVPSGQKHCKEHFKEVHQVYLEQGMYDEPWNEFLEWWSFHDVHHEWATRNELHAEMNAINHAAKKGIAIDGASLYITHSPCIFCVKNIISSGIKEVIYSKIYNEKDLKTIKSVFSQNQINFRRIQNDNRRRPGLFWQNYNK